jgi:uncharacterized protein (DUF1330 family)
MPTIDPTPQQFGAFAKAPIEGPVVMLNLLRFKPDGGEASYKKYGELAGPHLKRAGGKVLYQGRGRATVIGEDGWDEVLIVQYPSRQAFLDMVTHPDYQAITHLRTNALTDSRLYCTTPETGF